MWMIRNRNRGVLFADEFVAKGLVALGWDDTGPLNAFKSREEIINKVRAIRPEYKKMQAVTSGSQLDKVVNVIKIGDRVITYDPSKRLYHVGTVIGDYRYQPGAAEGAHQRPVRWEHTIERDKLSVPTKNSLGAVLSVFEIPSKAEQEFDALLSGKGKITAETPEEYATTEADVAVEIS